MSKEDKKVPAENQEDFILKKIRYYQGTIDDYETFWNKKVAEGEKEESPATKSLKKHNDELNKSYVIVPIEKDDTVLAKDIVSGKDVDEKPIENVDGKSSKKADDDKKKKQVEDEESTEEEEKKEEKGEDEEEVKEKDEKKEEKGEDDEKKKKK